VGGEGRDKDSSHRVPDMEEDKSRQDKQARDHIPEEEEDYWDLGTPSLGGSPEPGSGSGYIEKGGTAPSQDRLLDQVDGTLVPPLVNPSHH